MLANLIFERDVFFCSSCNLRDFLMDGMEIVSRDDKVEPFIFEKLIVLFLLYNLINGIA